MFGVDEQGHQSACRTEETPGKPKPNSQLVLLACDQLQRNYKAIPAKDEAGRTVPSVQNGIVAFTMK
jgi:hypothetical protein